MVVSLLYSIILYTFISRFVLRMPTPLNLSGFRRTAVAGENWLKRSEGKWSNLAHISLSIMFCLFFLCCLQWSPDGPLNVLVCLVIFLFPFAVPFRCSSQFHKVFSLYTHTDIVNKSLVSNNEVKDSFRRDNKMDQLGTSCLTTVSEGAWLWSSLADTGRIKSVQNAKG